MMKKILIFIGILLSGCVANQTQIDTHTATSNPTNLQTGYAYSPYTYGAYGTAPHANVVALLPISGADKAIGNDIKTSIETAFLRRNNPNIKLSFYDLSGDTEKRYATIKSALNTNPDIIIGPIFAEDAAMVRDIKPYKTPVISFTSDVNALGNNVVTMNLIPTQSIETIIHQMTKDGAKNMLILAPDDNSGQMMASVASKTASAYDIGVKGLYYYTSDNSESIKDVAIRASMHNARVAANNRAREILSDILTKESLTPQTRASLRNQLEKISRSDTLGKLPYDAVLFLGNGSDSKALASFLRYYGVDNRDITFYGTTLWNNSDVASDFTMSGAKYATLPEISDNFKSLYNMMEGKDPDYLTAFGYDAANLALAMIYSQKNQASYLFDPSGYIGTTGAFRVQPSGESEKTLRIMELNGSGTAETSVEAPTDFLTQIYSINTKNLRYASEKELNSKINPGDYIEIPDNLRSKSAYRARNIGSNYSSEQIVTPTPVSVQVFESSAPETVSNPEFESVKSETISRQYIDSVEIEE